MNSPRRDLVGATGLASGLALLGAAAVSGRVQAQSIPEAPTMTANTMQPPLHPTSGPDYQPVVTLNGWTLPWRQNGDWKEFHLVAEPVEREMAPRHEGASVGLQRPVARARPSRRSKATRCASSSPTSLPEHTTVHWHGEILPNGMDGVGGLTQPHIKPGKTFVYEFELKKSGTFMYHPHADEMVQMAMGMMGFFVVHPRDPKLHAASTATSSSCSAAYDIDPGTYVPKVTDDDRFQHVDLEQPRVSRHRSAGRALRATACACASATSP